MPTDLPKNLLLQLSPANVRWYALRAGWKPVDGVKRPLFLLNHPTDGLTQIHIPTAGSERDVAFLMGETVEKLAEFENRPARELLDELVLPTADTLREAVEPHRERVEGGIISLQAEPASMFEEFRGKVIVRAIIEGRPARVRFELNQEEYAAACNAHRDRQRVAITGLLQRDAQAKVFDLLQPQRFHVLSPEGDPS